MFLTEENDEKSSFNDSVHESCLRWNDDDNGC